MRAALEITVVGRDLPKPVATFEQANFPDYILEEVAKAGFVKPTPIQCQGWPMAMSGRDVIGIAQTGSGKTLAFILPGIVHINAQVFMVFLSLLKCRFPISLTAECRTKAMFVVV